MIRKGLLLSLAPLAVIVGMGAWGYLVAEPDARFPVHWGVSGQPDRYGGRLEAFIGLPAIAVALTALMAVLPRLDPRGTNLARSGPAYLTGWIGPLVLLAVIQTGLTLVALGVLNGDSQVLSRVVLAGGALLIAALGNVLGKARPNWFLGVRTPWTLSSDLVWERTHRHVGRIFVAAGLLLIPAALLLPLPVAAGALVAALLATAVWACVYSYLLWRRAPDRVDGPQVVDS